MKRNLCALLGLVFSATLMLPAYAANGCANATLTGDYSFNFTGWYVSVDKKGHLDLPNSTITNFVGLATFDGAGKMSSSFTNCSNGVCTKSKDKGTYSVNSDCSGKLKFGKAPVTPWTLAISNDGSQVYAMEIDATSNVSGVATKQ